MKFAVAALLSLLSVHSFAQEIIKTDIQVDGRYDQVGQTKKAQDRIRLGFTIDAGGVVEILGLIATGLCFWERLGYRCFN